MNVSLEKDGSIAVLTLDRPDRLNAMNDPMWEALYEHLGKIATDDEIRAVILTGAGRAFCSGGDVTAMAEVRPRVRPCPLQAPPSHRARSLQLGKTGDRRGARTGLRHRHRARARLRPGGRLGYREVLHGVQEGGCSARRRRGLLPHAVPRHRPGERPGLYRARRARRRGDQAGSRGARGARPRSWKRKRARWRRSWRNRRLTRWRWRRRCSTACTCRPSSS